MTEDKIREATLDLIGCVEQYIRQETSRSTLIWKKEKLKRLLEESASKQNSLLNFKPEGLEFR